MSDNIVLIGFMGTGKSSIASCLSSIVDKEVIEMDRQIESREGMSIPDIFLIKGEAYFREKETELLREVRVKKNIILSCGGGVILRDANVQELKKIGPVILLEASPETVYERVKEDKNRPLLNERMSVEYIREMMKSRSEKYNAAADILIDTNGRCREDICREILNKIERMEENNV